MHIPAGMKLVWDHIPNGRTAIDCGANNGKWTRPLADFFEKIIAVEPDPRAYQINKRQLPENAYIIHAAVGFEEGMMDFSVYPQSMNSRLGSYDGAKEVVSVSVITLNKFLAEDVDFIKIDVEGAEKDVLNGGAELIVEKKPVLVVETHSTEKAVKKIISDFGFYDIYVLGDSPRFQIVGVPK